MKVLKFCGAFASGLTAFIITPAVEPWRLTIALAAVFMVLVLMFAPMGKRNDDGSPDDPE